MQLTWFYFKIAVPFAVAASLDTQLASEALYNGSMIDERPALFLRADARLHEQRVDCHTMLSSPRIGILHA